MYLRMLKISDAPRMLEWMHDENVVGQLRGDFKSKTINDVEAFIKSAQNDQKNVHLAISSDGDEYMGTVSLKNIDLFFQRAEFAISIRSDAMGRGYSWYGMEEIIKKAFEEYHLEAVYWCVSRKNARAIRFYDKHNFHETVDIPKEIANDYSGINDLKWYSVLKGDVIDDRTEVAG